MSTEPYYEHAGIRIFHGDCLKVLRFIPNASVDAVVTDPPFAFAGGISNGMSSLADSQFFEHWLVSVFRELYRVSKPTACWFLWSDWRTVSVYDSALRKAAPDFHNQRWVSQVLVHDRMMIGMGSPFRNQTDWIAVIRGKKTDFGERIPSNQPNIIHGYWYYGKHAHHPVEKDPSVAGRLVEWATDPDQLVLDPFLGGGAVALAARDRGRGCIGIEIEQAYCDTAVLRLRQQILPMEVAS